MSLKMAVSWKNILQNECEKPYYKNLNPEKSNIAIGLHAGSVHAVCVLSVKYRRPCNMESVCFPQSSHYCSINLASSPTYTCTLVYTVNLKQNMECGVHCSV